MIDELDPYVVIYRRLEEYLKARRMSCLELIRTACTSGVNQPAAIQQP
jgi:adenylate cyclase